MYAHTHTHAHTNTHAHSNTHTHAHSNTHTALTHTYTCTHTHTHKAPAQLLLSIFHYTSYNFLDFKTDLIFIFGFFGGTIRPMQNEIPLGTVAVPLLGSCYVIAAIVSYVTISLLGETAVCRDFTFSYTN